MSITIVYFSNYSGNTKRFVEKIGFSKNDIVRIPISDDTPIVSNDFVLFVPTYGGGSDKSAIPKQVRGFLNIPENRNNLKAIVGFGNTNFGEHYCKAADMISQKTGAPVIGRVEIFGTQEDVQKIQERLALL